MRSKSWKSRSISALCIGAGLLCIGTASSQAQVVVGQRPRSWCPPSVPMTMPAPVPTAPAETTPTPAPKKTGEPPSTAPAPATTPPTVDTSAQTSPYDSGDLGAGELSSADSVVGYIDDAIPSNMARLRFDAAWRNNRSTRAEFFYAQHEPGGPGLPVPDTNIDYQEIMAYLEGKLRPDLSVFIDVPVRFLNPTLNDNHAGMGDINLGAKWAFVMDQDLVSSVQLRVYTPTGDAHLGLGTRHTSIEPGWLTYARLTDKVSMESELKLWVPVGGTDFAGEVVRYGVGFSYGSRSQDSWWATPVAEFVGWTVLSGKEVVAFPPLTIQDAAGDTIINAKLGLRVGLGDRFDVYSGYGRALTGEVWYKDIWRTELRLMF